MVVKLDPYPHDVAIGLGETPGYGSTEYSIRVQDAMMWLHDMGWENNREWRFTQIFGGYAAVLEFKKQKQALVFKVAWG